MTTRTIPTAPVLAHVVWTPLHGDPSAPERGRWVVESADGVYLGVLADVERHEESKVCTLLRYDLEERGLEVDFIAVRASGDHVTAYGPVPVDQDREAELDGAPQEPVRLTHGQQVAAELRRLAGIIQSADMEALGKDLSVNLHLSNHRIASADEAAARRRAVDRLTEVLQLDEPVLRDNYGRGDSYESSRLAGLVGVFIKAVLPKSPHCACGATCTHGGTS
jgi:hypothetical protein